NFADTLFRQGQYAQQPQLPDTPGLEAAGVIEKVGEGVNGLSVGQRVAAIGAKAYSEYMVARASQVIPIPDHVSFDEGAAFPIQVLTAWHIIHTSHHTGPGMTVVVHSAAGGVGIVAVQIAKAAGAHVIGTVSSASKAALAKEYGANEVVNYATQDFSAEVMRITENRGADLILDAVGKPTFEKGLNCLAPMGHLVLYGRAGGPPDPLNVFKLFQKSTKVSGFMLNQQHTGKEQWQRGVEHSFQLMKEGKLKLLIGKKFPLVEAPEAHRFMESRGSTGKLVLVP
ncbi:MAG TPA: quinone oxidoreductase, partial [Candidatus Binataceae bacterium]|nr:quinone oxidoreductase [Candidatus Binataceae bacterium]